MAENCIFCRIVAGEIPASVVYRDDDTLAFLDIQPVNPGHTLVIPRQHVASIRDLDPMLSGHLWAVATQIAKALPSSGVRLDGLNLFVADGAEAGQEVFHVHLHVIPRFAGDGFGLRFGPHNRQMAERATLDHVAAQLRAAGGWST